MTVNAAYATQDPNHPPVGSYVQPSAGITASVVTLSDTTGVSLTGAAGTGSAAVLTVQGNASGTAIPVSGTGLGGGVAQASTTSGQLGTLIQGAVTTGLPTYTTAQTDPLSLDTSGRARTVGWLYRDSTVTAQASGTQTAPTAGTVIATVTPGTAGIWEVVATISISGTSVVATESNNMGLYQTAGAKLAPIVYAATTAGTAAPVSTGRILLNLSGVDTVNVKAIGNATATTPIYAAAVVCRLVG
jgi:hypothetical protein